MNPAIEPTTQCDVIDYSSSPTPVIIYDSKGEILSLNNSFRKLNELLSGKAPGYSPASITDIFQENVASSLLNFLAVPFCSEAKFDSVLLNIGENNYQVDRLILKKEIASGQISASIQLLTGNVIPVAPPVPGISEKATAQGIKIRIDIDRKDVLPASKTNTLLPVNDFCELLYAEDVESVLALVNAAVRARKKHASIIRLPVKSMLLFARLELFPVGKKALFLAKLKILENTSDYPEIIEQNTLPPFPLIGQLKYGVFLTDEKGNCDFCNTAWLDLNGQDSSEIIGASWMKNIHEKEKEWAMNLWLVSYKNQLRFEYELRLVDPDSGKIKWILVQSFFHFDGKNKFYFGGVAHDITDKKNTEHKLNAVRQNYNSLFNSIQEAFVIVGYDRTVINCNQKFAELFGYSTPSELIGKSTESFTPSNQYHNDVWAEVGISFLRDRKYSSVIELKRKDKTTFSAKVIAGEIMDEDGGSLSIGASVVDISSELEKEMLAKKNANMLTELTKALDHALLVSVTDANGIITYVNESFAETFGFTPEEFIGKTHKIINSDYHPLQFFKKMWNTVLSGKPWKGVIRNKLRDGSIHWTDTSINPLFDEHGNITHFISLRYDITRFIAKNNLLLRNLKELQEKDESKIAVTDVTPLAIESTKQHTAAAYSESKAFLKFFSEISCPVIYLGKKHGTEDYFVKDYNTEAENLFSTDRAEFVGKSLDKINNVVFDHFKNIIIKHISGELVSMTSLVHLTNALMESWYDIRIVRLSEDEVIVILEDVSRWAEKAKAAKLKTAKLELQLQESRHRIRNNLQLIISLSTIHRNKLTNAEVESALIETENRVKTISFINDSLDHSQKSGRINIEPYTKELIKLLVSSYEMKAVKVETEIAPLYLAVTSAMHYGIMLNELLANCFKHAFGKAGKGLIRITLHKDEQENYILSIKDNGKGVDTATGEFEHSNSWGIIKGLSANMNGKAIFTTDQDGTFASVTFRD